MKPLETMWAFFDPVELQGFIDAGWLLLDYELLPNIDNPYNFSELPPGSVFGVFVKPEQVVSDGWSQEWLFESNALPFFNFAKSIDMNAHPARITDFEFRKTPGGDGPGLQQASSNTYSSLWLMP